MWKGALQIWQDYPLFGVGIGRYAQYYDSPQYWPPESREKGHTHPHNYLVKVLSEQGIWGLAFCLLLHGAVAWQLFQVWKHSSGKHRKSQHSVAFWRLLDFSWRT